jgi:hypothetical protein
MELLMVGAASPSPRRDSHQSSHGQPSPPSDAGADPSPRAIVDRLAADRLAESSPRGPLNVRKPRTQPVHFVELGQRVFSIAHASPGTVAEIVASPHRRQTFRLAMDGGDEAWLEADDVVTEASAAPSHVLASHRHCDAETLRERAAASPPRSAASPSRAEVLVQREQQAKRTATFSAWQQQAALLEDDF